ncbi:unnamed protein product [Danaus chrysippus]|uniref:(African queen) hypothetical protein n=1 Tax=Danaus chrysippus TaxID=151541 RepID=A0A8J2QQ89_9NEOP|nr:unnamed protein product [Danaus chrysippus]
MSKPTTESNCGQERVCEEEFQSESESERPLEKKLSTAKARCSLDQRFRYSTNTSSKSDPEPSIKASIKVGTTIFDLHLSTSNSHRTIEIYACF